MIVSTPVNLPALVPSSWDTWWQIWEKYAAPLEKELRTPNQSAGKWIGFDVIRSPGFRPAYSANFVDLAEHDPALLAQIQAVPVYIRCARFIMSKSDFPAHIDFGNKSWALRSMFFCEDPAAQWYYTDMAGNNVKYLTLPASTNWWAYLDGSIKHGTVYSPTSPKIILQVFSDSTRTAQLVRQSSDIFKDYAIEYDINTGL